MTKEGLNNDKILPSRFLQVVSATSCAEMQLRIIKHPITEVTVRTVDEFCIFDYLPGHVEKMAIIKFIKIIQNRQDYRENMRIAIITDHELMLHAEINAQRKSLFENFFLPVSFTLLYASGDVGKENYMNKAMRMCDNEANNLLSKIEPIRHL